MARKPFLLDVEDRRATAMLLNGCVRPSLLYNLDGDDASVALAIMPPRPALRYLPALFDALVELHYLADGGAMSLSDVDACLGCPLLLFDADLIASVDAPALRAALSDGLVHAANWIRTLVNAFVGQRGEETAFKVQKRLVDLDTIEEHIEALALGAARAEVEEAADDAEEAAEEESEAAAEESEGDAASPPPKKRAKGSAAAKKKKMAALRKNRKKKKKSANTVRDLDYRYISCESFAPCI